MSRHLIPGHSEAAPSARLFDLAPGFPGTGDLVDAAGPGSRPMTGGQCSDLDGTELLPIEEAFRTILARASPIEGTERFAPFKAAGRVTSEAIRSPIALPPFDQSAVDGFGFADSVNAPQRSARIVSRVEAGGSGARSIREGEAVRLFTGAPVPAGVEAVAKQETCVTAGNSVISATSLSAGSNIRRKGEDIPAGSVLVEPGAILDARHLALLAAVGCTAVEVVRRVRIMVISTGNELYPPGQPLPFGGVYDSNRPMLLSLLGEAWIEPIDGGAFRDQRNTLAKAMREGATRADIIVSTGGASGSATDHTAEAVRLAGGTADSHSLALRPGKPIVIGSIGRTAVLGLPGNPVAALVGFLLFGRALARAFVGVPWSRPRGHAAVIARPVQHTMGRTEFILVRVVAATSGDGPLVVEQAGRSGSARLAPLTGADGLAEIPANTGNLAEGSLVAFHPFRSVMSI